MKAKLFLWIMLMAIPFNLCLANKHHKRKPVWKTEHFKETMHRSPSLPVIDTEEKNGYLYLTFQFALPDADLTIKDSNGNEVVNEQNATLFIGRTIILPINEDSYPYSIEITSPLVDIRGEITLEY